LRRLRGGCFDCIGESLGLHDVAGQGRACKGCVDDLDGLLASAWVLGDLAGLRVQLVEEAARTAPAGC